MASWTNKGTYYEWVGDEQSIYTLGNEDTDEKLYLDNSLFSSTLRNYIPAYTELSKVEVGLYWRTSVWSSKGDGYLYIGDTKVGGEWNTGKDYRDDWADNPSNLVGYFQSGTANVGIPSPSVRARFEASWGRTSYYTFKLRWYPVWTCNFYNESTLLKTVKVNMGNTLSDPAIVPTKPADNQYTYQFSGWDKAFGTPTTNTNYYAQFIATPRKYTVVTSGNNGTVEGITNNGIYEYGNTVTLTATPNNGYKFVKWSDDNTDNPRTITVTRDVTYTAIFEPITYYTVFDLDGGTLSYDNKPIEYSYESPVSLHYNDFLGKEITVIYDAQGGECGIGGVSTYKSLLGWEDLGSIKMPDGTIYTADTFDAPYYANKYYDVRGQFGYDKYAVALHYHNIGKGEGRQCVNTEGNKERGLYPTYAQLSHLTNIDGHTVTLKCRWEEPTFRLPTPTRAGHEFLGWSDGANIYQAGETVSFAENTTLYAQWKPKSIFVGDTPAQGVFVGDTPAKAIYIGTEKIYER